MEAAHNAAPSGAPRPRVLVVEDEEGVRRSLQIRLERMGYDVLLAEDGQRALDRLAEAPGLRLVLCDLRMPNLDGFAFLDAVRGRDLSVLAMSAYGDPEVALQALRAGAADYISKPFRTEELQSRLHRFADLIRLEEENKRLKAEIQHRGSLEGFVGRSPAARAVMEAVSRVSAYSSTVLLTGESGTGKEVLARALHARSPRAEGPFVAVNCAAIPESLLESELFGHERGAFTGAVRARAGLFE